MTALVTGASTGIGLELAKQLAEKKYSLILVARSTDKLEKIKGDLEAKYGISVEIVTLDLSNPDSALALFDRVSGSLSEIDVLINNAGFGYAGPFTAMEYGGLKEMIDLNMTTLSLLTYLFSREMVKRKRGRIMNVASVAAYQPGPLMAVYYATKAYVLSLSEALHQELKDQGITITALCPGPVNTEFGSRARISTNKMLAREFLSTSAKDVAEKGLAGLFSGKKVVIPGVTNKILVQSNRLAPRGMVLNLIKRIHTKAMRH